MTRLLPTASSGTSTRLLTALVLAAACAASACSNNTTAAASTTPTTPSLGILTETFAGTLTTNGAQSFPFAVSASGTVSATLNSIAPDASLVVGFSLGTWNGSSCTIVLSNDNATSTTVINGTASGAGNLCVRIYDVGYVATPASYIIQVNHL